MFEGGGVHAQKDPAHRFRRFGGGAFYRVLADHWQHFVEVYERRFERTCGKLRGVVQRVVERFMDCGNPLNGLAHVTCECGRDFWIPFSCKCRGICPSCQARFAAEWAEWLADTLLEPVVHRHVTFTIPKILRPYFRYNRKLMNGLSRAAHRAVYQYIEFFLGPGFTPGMVAVRQWFGRASRFHPHLHCLIAQGAWSQDRQFTPLFIWDADKIRELFEVEVFRFLREAGLLTQQRLDLIKSWRHSGFNVHLERSLHPSDPEETKQLGRYLLRAPVAQNRLEYDRENQSVTLDTGDGQGVCLDVLDFIARVVVQIPDKYERSTVYYGIYSNASKLRQENGARQAEQAAQDQGEPPQDFRNKKKTRLRWAQLMDKIWREDPLLCQHCGAQMRIVAFVTSPDNLGRILDHLDFKHADRPPPKYRAPPKLCPNPLG